MSSSPAKLAANRRNAQSSNGPRTLEGKRRSAANSLRHGLCAKRAVVPGESEDEFGEFRDHLRASLQPVNAVEEALAERIVGAAWRLRRAGRIENEIFERAGDQGRLDAYRTGRAIQGQLGWAFEAATDATLDRLGRYETRLERSMLRALHELQRIRTGQLALLLEVDVAADVRESSPSNEGGGFVSQSIDEGDAPVLRSLDDLFGDQLQ